MLRHAPLLGVLGLLSLVACKGGDPAADSGPDAHRSTCDAAALSKLADEIAALPESEQGVKAAAGMLASCGSALPGAVREAYATPGSVGGIDLASADEATLAFFDQVCPDAQSKVSTVNELNFAQRSGALFKACALDGYGLVVADQMAAMPATLTAWGVYKAIVDGGLAPERARPIGLALLRLEASGLVVAPSEDQSLPTVQGDPLGEGPTLFISRAAASLEGRRVTGLLDNGLFETRQMGNGNDRELLKPQVIAPLLAALQTLAESERAKGSGSAGRLKVAADADFPFLSITDLILTARRAGFTELAFVVDTGGGQQGQILTLAPKSAEADGSKLLELELLAEGLGIGQGPETGAPTIRHPRGAHEEITKAARELLAQDPSAHRVHVSSTLAVPLARLLKAVESARGPTCGLSAGECLLRDVSIVAEGAHSDSGGVVAPADVPPDGGGPVGFKGVGQRSHIASMSSQVTGSLSQDLVFRAVGRHMEDILGCYDRALETSPTLTGDLAFNFRILPPGTTDQYAIDIDLPDPAVGQCVGGLVSTWTFAPPPDGQSVRVEFKLGLAPGVPAPPDAQGRPTEPAGPKPTEPPPGLPEGERPPKPTYIPEGARPPGPKPTAPPPGMSEKPPGPPPAQPPG